MTSCFPRGRLTESKYGLSYPSIAKKQIVMADPPRAKKAKRSSHFDRKWATEFAGIAASSKGKYINSGHFSLASYVM